MPHWNSRNRVTYLEKFNNDKDTSKNEYIAPKSSVSESAVVQVGVAEPKKMSGGGYAEVKPVPAPQKPSSRISQDKLRKFVNLKL
jgi:hypothetical protein